MTEARASLLHRTESLDGARALLERHAAVIVPGAWSEETCATWTRGVYAARAAWVTNFGGVQFTLGRAWYTHLEQDAERAYFEGARASDAAVEKYCPGLQTAARELASRVIGEEVIHRRAWCGPGVHIFPAGRECAKTGGEIHFDTEGLAPGHRASRAPAITCVIMMQPAELGGGLAVWDATSNGGHDVTDDMPERERAIAEYAVGTLVVIDSYRLHQIQPFTGARDRISVTIHAARVGGRWESWF